MYQVIIYTKGIKGQVNVRLAANTVHLEIFILVLISHNSCYNDMHENKSSIKHALQNCLCNIQTFIKIDLVVAEIIASKGPKEPQTSTLKSHEKLAVSILVLGDV